MAGELPSMRAVIRQLAVVDTCKSIALLVSVLVCVCVIGGRVTKHFRYLKWRYSPK